jgi:hypothetical protein
MRISLSVIAMAAALAGTGCLSNRFTIREAELHRLAATPPEKRGERVEVLQRIGMDEEPSAEPVEPHMSVVVIGPLPPGGAAPMHPVHRPAPADGLAKPTPPAGAGKPPHDSADMGAAVAAAAAAGLGIAIGLGTTEGARYDGWVRVHPMHPVHLKQSDGSEAWVPLAYLDERAIGADEVYLNRDEGPWVPLGRAPLNRVGGAFGFEAGAAALNSAASSTVWGFWTRLALGGFFTKQIGLALTLGLGTGVSGAGKTTFNARFGPELRYYPLRLGVFELGGYATGGFAPSSADLPTYEWSKNGFFYGGGGLMEIELTTRLALGVRAGLSVLPNDRPVVGPEFTVGLTVY